MFRCILSAGYGRVIGLKADLRRPALRPRTEAEPVPGAMTSGRRGAENRCLSRVGLAPADLSRQEQLMNAGSKTPDLQRHHEALGGSRSGVSGRWSWFATLGVMALALGAVAPWRRGDRGS